MKLAAVLLFCLFCAAVRAEFPPADDDVSSAIDDRKPDKPRFKKRSRSADADRDSDEDRSPDSGTRDIDKDNPFSGQPDDALDEQPNRKLKPRSQRAKKRKHKPRYVDRDPDADEDSADVSEDDVIRPSRDQATTIRLGFYTGVSFMNNANQNIASERSLEGLNQVYPIGILAEVQGYRYFGGELDGYYALSPNENITSSGTAGSSGTGGTGSGSSGSSSSAASASKSILPYGGDILVKGIYPFDHGRQFKWYPSIGLGYGYHILKASVTQGATSAATSGTSATDVLQASGFVISFGVELAPSRELRFNIDYATSLAASGSLVQNSATPAVSLSGGAGTFTRLRVAGYYQITPEFNLGVMALWRTLSANFGQTVTSTGAIGSNPGTSPTGDPESQLQMTLCAQYEW